ncbi:aspartate-semialdehyde dehydrogenase, partial [Candidatus Aminicenantes bacterium AC-708-M15]|nr:aspartate-semialdehyde dehydrogenase [Candidatus Aminicenantes bacterium AC-708-M15]
MGCTGLVGQQFIKMLSNHPYFEISCLTASSNSEGKKYNEVVNWMLKGEIPNIVKNLIIEKTSIETFIKNNIKIVFSALPSSVAKDIEIELRNNGLYIFSNASAHRMNEEIPIIIPEINPEHFELAEKQKNKYGGFVITNSNCTTSGFVMALKPILNLKLKSAIITTYQSISGAGRKGIPAMSIFGNVIPYIKDEEEKIERETKKILGQLVNGKIKEKEIEVIANCARVPVPFGHLECITLEFEREINESLFIKNLINFKGEPQKLRLPSAPERPIILINEKDRPQPIFDIHTEKGMAVVIGRIRRKNNKISFFLHVNNLVRGAAGTSVLNAEYALKKEIIEN